MSDFQDERDRVYWEVREREEDAFYEGDARRCPRHPEVRTSSPDGMIDGLCWICESEMGAEPVDEAEEAAYHEAQRLEAERIMATPEWQAEATRRAGLSVEEAQAELRARLLKDDDDIPF